MGMETLKVTQVAQVAQAVQPKSVETSAKPVNQGGTAQAAATQTQQAVRPVIENKGRGSGEEKQGQQGKDGQATEKQIKAAIEHVTRASKMSRTRCEFSYHEPTKRVSIKVLDEETNEVIKEIPPEKSLEMVEKMWELAGILVDEKR